VVDLGGRTAISLAVGNNHTCVVLDDARVKCWGGNEDGQLGLGDTNRRGASPGQMGAALSPVDLGGRPAARVAVGNKFSCAILVDGGVVCWGRNTYGQLGTGDRTSRGRAPGEMGTSLPTLNLGAGRTVKQVGLGDNHVCARLDNGAVKCWGRNSSKGELGLGDTSDRGGQPGDLGDTLPAVNLGSARTALDLAVGLRHTCAALDNGAVKCWGENGAGQLGQGNTTDLGASPSHMGDALRPVPLD
jgi:alpha-tubulin suppressor-like RCC1 family protein